MTIYSKWLICRKSVDLSLLYKSHTPLVKFCRSAWSNILQTTPEFLYVSFRPHEKVKRELMLCRCDTNIRRPWWTFLSPWKPKLRPGAQKEPTSPAWLVGIATCSDECSINLTSRLLRQTMIQPILYSLHCTRPYIALSVLFQRTSTTSWIIYLSCMYGKVVKCSLANCMLLLLYE